MRVHRTFIGLLLSCLLVAVVLPVPARAAWLQEHGWWWHLQTGLQGVEVPPPGDVPEDGLLVEQTITGPSAVSAVRVDLEGESDPVLSLAVSVAGVAPPDATIVACPADGFWLSAHGGTWDQRPEADCDAGEVEGQPDAEGTTWTWDLAPLVEDGGVDVVLLPRASVSFRVAFEPPTDASVATTPAPSTRPGPGTFSPLPAPPPPPSSPAPAPSFGTGTPVRVGPPPATTPPGASPPQVAPSAASSAPATTEPAVSAGDPATALLVVDPAAARRTGRVLLFAVLLLAAALLWGSRPWVAEAGVGGLGRFRRPRRGTPPPLR